jgi:hypothetical protein
MFDLYIHTYILPEKFDEHVNNIVYNYDNKQYKILDIDYNIIVDKQEEIDKILNFEEFVKKKPWGTVRKNSSNLMKNLLRQLYLLNKVYEQTKKQRL